MYSGPRAFSEQDEACWGAGPAQSAILLIIMIVIIIISSSSNSMNMINIVMIRNNTVIIIYPLFQSRMKRDWAQVPPAGTAPSRGLAPLRMIIIVIIIV